MLWPKIVIISILVTIDLLLSIRILSNIKKHNQQREYLEKVCTKQTKARLKRFQNENKTWCGVYRYNVKNYVGEYTTPPQSYKIEKPKIGSQISIYVNPNNSEEIFNPKADLHVEKSHATKMVAIANILVVGLSIFIATR